MELKKKKKNNNNNLNLIMRKQQVNSRNVVFFHYQRKAMEIFWIQTEAIRLDNTIPEAEDRKATEGLIRASDKIGS